MAVSVPVHFENFTLDLGNGVHGPLASQVFKVALTNVAPNAATMNGFEDITELTAVNGYTAGGNECPFVSWTQTGGEASLFLDDPEDIIATGGDIGPFQWIVLYNSSAPTDTGLVWYADYGAPITLVDGTPFPIQLDQVNGVIRRSFAQPAA